MKDDDVSALTFDVGSAIHIPPHHPLRHPSQPQPQPGPGQQLQQPHDESNDEFLTRLRRNLDGLDIRETHNHDDDDHPSGNHPPSPHDDDPRVSTGHLALIQETDDQVGHDGRETRLLMADLLREGLHDDDDDDDDNGGASNENDNQTLKKRKKEKKKSKKSHRSKSSKDSKRDRTSSSKKQSKRNSSSKDLIRDRDATRRDSDKRKEEMRLRKKEKRAAAAAAMANDRPSSDAIEEFPLKEIRLPRPPSPSPSSDGEASDTNAERRSSFSVDSTAETAESTHSRSGQVCSRRLGTKEEEEEDRCGKEQENPFAKRESNRSKSNNDHDETEEEEEEEEDSTTRLDHESLSRLSYFTEHTHDSSYFSHSRQPYPYQQRRSKQSRTLSQHSLSQSQRSLSQPSQSLSQSQSQPHAFHQSFGHASHSTYGNLSYNTHSTTTTTASHTHHLTRDDLLRLRHSVAQSQSELRQVLQIKHRLESEIRALQTSLFECQSRHRERQVELRSSTEEMERFQFFLEKMERENVRLRKAVGDMEEREDEERLEQVLGSMEEKMWKLRSGGGGGSRRRSVGMGFGRKGSLGSVSGVRKAQAVLGKKDSVGTAAGKLEGNAMEAKVCPGIYSKRSSM